MRGKRKVISIILILSLLCCSCGMERKVGDAVESEQVAKESTVEKLTVEETKEMPAIVFFLLVELSWWKWDQDINMPKFLISFVDNQGNLYSARDAYFNELTYQEIYDEFAEGKLNHYLTLDTTCDLDELRENYELLQGVAKNEELQLIPDSEFNPAVVLDDYWWSACYYNEDGNLSWVTIRHQLDHPCGVTYRTDDKRTDQIYEWLASVSETWK